MYTPGPSAEHMAAWGLVPEDFADDAIEVWPENWPAVLLFDDLGLGSWNVGPNGFLGIRPEAMREVRLAHHIKPAEWPEMFRSLKVMESAALAVLNKERS